MGKIHETRATSQVHRAGTEVPLRASLVCVPANNNKLQKMTSDKWNGSPHSEI